MSATEPQPPPLPSSSSLPPPPPPPPSTASRQPLPHANEHVALVGLGAIGISFLALHLTYTAARVSVYDPRPDLAEHVAAILPLYLPSSAVADSSTSSSSPQDTFDVATLTASGRLRFCSTLQEAVEDATIVQEQGPEKLAFKQATWSEVVRHASPDAHLWSSTSGIPASAQLAPLSPDVQEGASPLSWPLSAAQRARAAERLLVVHPFNPPHLMPLLEVVPSPTTHATRAAFATEYFATPTGSIHRATTLRRETKGFVANRLSFVLFREACALVAAGVCTVAELDAVVRASLGPRWAVGGPFWQYNFGGGPRGLDGFLDNIGGAIDEVWRDIDHGAIDMRRPEWRETVVAQTLDAYGVPGPEDIRNRDRGLRAVVKMQDDWERENTRGETK